MLRSLFRLLFLRFYEFCFQLFDSGFDVAHFFFKVSLLFGQFFLVVFQGCDFLFCGLWWYRLRVSGLNDHGWWVRVPASAETSSPSAAKSSAPASAVSASRVHESWNGVACAVSGCSSGHGSSAPRSCSVSSWHVFFTSILCLCTIYIY